MWDVSSDAGARIASSVGLVLLLVSSPASTTRSAPQQGQGARAPAFLSPAPPVPGMQAMVRGSDGNFWAEGWDGHGWSGWHAFAGPFASAPALASWGPGRLDVLAQGTDMQLWHAWWEAGAWRGWEPLGGVLASGPAIATRGSNQLDVTVKGTDGQVWHKSWGPRGWSGWESLGGIASSAPAAASWGGGRLDVFVRGSDAGLWHKSLAGTGWSRWESLGGVLNSDPSSVSWGSGRIDVVVQGTDNASWHRWFQDGWWSDWGSLGGSLTSGAGTASWGPGQLDIFVRGTDGAEWHKRWGSRGWSSWQGLGGVLSSAPGASSWLATSNVISGVPFHQQVYELSCEEAALQMGLAHQSLYSTQGQILRDVGVDARHGFYSGSVLRWGDPYVNFVGNVNGSEVALTGYGTYHSTIARVAGAYGANVLGQGEGIIAADVYRAVLQNHPVVVWVSFDWRYHPPGSWLAFDGRWVQYEGPIEHAVTVVGVNQGSVYVFNPWFGPQWVSKSKFESAYATYHGMAVVLQ